MRWKGLALIILVTASAVATASILSYSYFCSARDSSIAEIASDPQSFNGAYVLLHGYVVETGYMFGPKYVLRDFDQEVEIALGGKGGAGRIDLEPYVSFVFDGRNYTQIRNLRVSVVGYVHYIGLVMDAPSFYLDVRKVEPDVTELEIIVIEFLKTTDISNAGWNETVEILEIYDHRFGGTVVVVRYITMNAVHPHFMCEAIEEHVAVITLNQRGEVTSAFCVWGSFHGQDRIWDLVNQRWIHN